MSRALVTGITGQDGYYLAKLLHEKGHEVYGLIRGQDNPKEEAFRKALPYVNLIGGDLLDERSLDRAMRVARPDYVFNLAAITYIPFSWEQPDLVYNVNFLGVSRLLAACERVGVSKFVQASTSEMFGKNSPSVPESLDESSPMLPSSPYAIAKLAAHHLCLAYKHAGKVNAASVIMFNHESPRRGENFVTRKITLAAARIKHGKQDKLSLGSPIVIRDWGYAPEYMEALYLVALTPSASDSYVVSTGVDASIRDFAYQVFSLARLPFDRIHFGEMPPRPNDVTFLRGDSSKITRELGWKPQTFWPELAKIMLDADMRKVEESSE